jgi:glycerophosphoryl diester phosphodiesterase
MFECDVKASADGQLFLLHDATLERTTNGSGLAGQLAWAELSRLDAGGWHGRRHAGEPLPTLEAIARYVLRNGFLLDVEIKPTPGTEAATGAAVARRCAELWSSSPWPVVAPPLLTSFSPEALQAAQQAEPALPLGLLLDKWRDGWLEESRALDCVAVITHHAMLDAAVIDTIHAEGWKCLAYTVNDACEAQRLLAAGIDGMVTDAVDRFSPGITLFD